MSLASKSFLRLVSYVEKDRVKLLSPEFPCLMGPVKGWLENISDEDMFSPVWNVYHCLCVKEMSLSLKRKMSWKHRGL